jgi:hypothetical protein
VGGVWGYGWEIEQLFLGVEYYDDAFDPKIN